MAPGPSVRAPRAWRARRPARPAGRRSGGARVRFSDQRAAPHHAPAPPRRAVGQENVALAGTPRLGDVEGPPGHEVVRSPITPSSRAQIQSACWRTGSTEPLRGPPRPAAWRAVSSRPAFAGQPRRPQMTAAATLLQCPLSARRRSAPETPPWDERQAVSHDAALRFRKSRNAALKRRRLPRMEGSSASGAARLPVSGERRSAPATSAAFPVAGGSSRDVAGPDHAGLSLRGQETRAHQGADPGICGREMRGDKTNLRASRRSNLGRRSS